MILNQKNSIKMQYRNFNKMPEMFETGIVPEVNSEADRLNLAKITLKALVLAYSGYKPCDGHKFQEVLNEVSRKIGMPTTYYALNAYLEGQP